MTVLDPDRTAEVTDAPEAAAGRWEACSAFASGETGSAICGECGWLADEHTHVAVVRALTRAPRSAQPDRLAS